ncbi:hypothetical protein C1646_714209 [Rhizophagus diaphanus]|nr:hypothetical protein C1646_714209 [Rhizophagus diaphanus] [Rhizophagus sp. MUCL 43196]
MILYPPTFYTNSRSLTTSHPTNYTLYNDTETSLRHFTTRINIHIPPTFTTHINILSLYYTKILSWIL